MKRKLLRTAIAETPNHISANVADLMLSKPTLEQWGVAIDFAGQELKIESTCKYPKLHGGRKKSRD